jgi:hypothetical protein
MKVGELMARLGGFDPTAEVSIVVSDGVHEIADFRDIARIEIVGEEVLQDEGNVTIAYQRQHVVIGA